MKETKTTGKAARDHLTPDDSLSVEEEARQLRERLIELNRRLKKIERASTRNV
jgi:hypothetical protein